MEQATDVSNGIVDNRTARQFELGIPGREPALGRKLPRRSTDRQDVGVAASAKPDEHHSNFFSPGLRDIALPNALQPHSRSARARRAPAFPGAGRVPISTGTHYEWCGKSDVVPAY
jgi:hypothetical protein